MEVFATPSVADILTQLSRLPHRWRGGIQQLRLCHPNDESVMFST